jgi:hypothetical protein
MDWNFQKITLTIAIVLLVLALIFIAISLANAKAKETWPPIVGECPDYWTDMAGNSAMCVNTQRLGTCNIPTSNNKNAMDFTTSNFQGSNGTCAKYTWATNCGVTWDGITSGISNPCANTSVTSSRASV